LDEVAVAFTWLIRARDGGAAFLLSDEQLSDLTYPAFGPVCAAADRRWDGLSGIAVNLAFTTVGATLGAAAFVVAWVQDTGPR
jgi:hypothetical protein